MALSHTTSTLRRKILNAIIAVVTETNPASLTQASIEGDYHTLVIRMFRNSNLL